MELRFHVSFSTISLQDDFCSSPVLILKLVIIEKISRLIERRYCLIIS